MGLIVMRCCCPHGKKATAAEKAARIAALQQILGATAPPLAPGATTQETAPRAALFTAPAATPEETATRLELLTLEHTTPVFVQAFCGNDRDCIAASGKEPNFESALKNAENWSRLHPSRYSIISDFETRSFLHQEGPRGGAAARATITRGEQAAEIARTERLFRPR